MEDERWTKSGLNWRPFDRTRPLAKPPKNMDDDIKRFVVRGVSEED